MAIIDKETLFNTENLNGAKWSFGVPLERTNPVPIDKWSTFKTYADAVEFVNRETGNIAYPGQMITIEDPDTNVVDVYVVDRTATDCLKKLASGGSADEIAQKLSQLSSQLLSADGIIDQLSAAHNALSDALSTEISAEAIARDEAIEALSTALSTDIDALSAALSTEISAETEAREEAVEALSTALSTEIDVLSTALSTEISAETEARKEAIKALEDKLSSAWQFRGTVDAAVDEDNVAKIEAAFNDPQSGNVVIVNKKFVDEDGTESTVAIEYAFDGKHWQQLGDESSSVSKFELKDAIEKLSATVSAEIDADVGALSDAVSADIEALSTALSTEISALADESTKAVQKLSDDLSSDIDALSTALSTEISALADESTKAVQKLSADLSADIDALSDDLSAEIDALSDSLSAEIDALSDALSADLSAEIKAREENDEFLSAEISSKIQAIIGDADEDAGNASPVDKLTIHKISQDKYEELLTSNALVDTDLYVVSSEYINGYGEQIKNIANGVEATDGAAYGQLMELSTALSDDIKLSVQTLEKKIEDAVEGGVEALSNELLTPETGIIPVLDAKVEALDDKVDTLSTNLSNEIKALSVALSTDLSAEIEARKAADKAQDEALSAWKDLVGLSAADGTADGQVVTWGQVKDITTAMHFHDAITSSEDKAVEVVLAEITDPVKGDVVIDTATSKEYVYTGTEWRELGDEGMYVTKSEYNEFLTGTYEPFTANVELSVENLSSALSTLSGEVADNKAAIEATVAAEVARAKAAEKAVDDKVNELSTYTHALSVSQLVWDIDLIDCGNATGFNA